MSNAKNQQRSEVRVKTQIVFARVTLEEKIDIERRASEYGVKVAQFLRDAAMNRRSMPKTDAHLINELRRQGGLLIKLSGDLQLVHANDARIDDLVREMKSLYREIYKTIRVVSGRSGDDSQSSS